MRRRPLLLLGPALLVWIVCIALGVYGVVAGCGAGMEASFPTSALCAYAWARWPPITRVPPLTRRAQKSVDDQKFVVQGSGQEWASSFTLSLEQAFTPLVTLSVFLRQVRS